MEKNEFYEKWALALESGVYEQCRNILYDYYEETYCCLGVACKVLDQPMGYDPLYEFISTGDQNKFIEMNDKDKLNFKEISSYIRKTYLD